MNNTIITEVTDISSYVGEEEIRAAVKACCGRCCNACESPFEYALRKRNIDLSELLDKAIENELSDNEKSVIKDIYYDNMSSAGVAEKRGISRSTVNATRLRAEKKLYSVLRYVKMYQQDFIGKGCDDLLSQIAPVTYGKHCSGAGFPKNLRSERLSHNISIEKISDATGINPQRIRDFESGELLPDIAELKSLSIAFGTTPDRLLDFERINQ